MVCSTFCFSSMLLSLLFSFFKGACDRVIRAVDLKSLAPHRCGFESCQGLLILSYEDAIQLLYVTSVVLLRCPLGPEMKHPRSSFTSKVGKSPYNIYTVGTTSNPTKKISFTFVYQYL